MGKLSKGSRDQSCAAAAAGSVALTWKARLIDAADAQVMGLAITISSHKGESSKIQCGNCARSSQPAAFVGICPPSLATASLDGLDFKSKHAAQRKSLFHEVTGALGPVIFCIK